MKTKLLPGQQLPLWRIPQIAAPQSWLVSLFGVVACDILELFNRTSSLNVVTYANARVYHVFLHRFRNFLFWERNAFLLLSIDQIFLFRFDGSNPFG